MSELYLVLRSHLFCIQCGERRGMAALRKKSNRKSMRSRAIKLGDRCYRCDNPNSFQGYKGPGLPRVVRFDGATGERLDMQARVQPSLVQAVNPRDSQTWLIGASQTRRSV